MCVCVCVCVCARARARVCVCLCVSVSLSVSLSSLVCMVGVIYVYVDTALRFMGFFLNCLVGCLSMIVWTPTVLSVLYACVLYFCTSPCSAKLSMFHMERRSRNTLNNDNNNIIIINVGSDCVPTQHSRMRAETEMWSVHACVPIYGLCKRC